MAIRLKLKLERGNKAVEVIALVNSGYETLEPEILLPENHAKNLGIYPNLPPFVTVSFFVGISRHSYV